MNSDRVSHETRRPTARVDECEVQKVANRDADVCARWQQTSRTGVNREDVREVDVEDVAGQSGLVCGGIDAGENTVQEADFVEICGDTNEVGTVESRR